MNKDDLLAAKDAAYWLAAYVHFLSTIAARGSIYDFKKCITEIRSPDEDSSDDPDKTVDFGELFCTYRATIAPVLSQIPSISETPPSFGNASPAASLHAAILEYGRTLNGMVERCYHKIVAIEDVEPVSETRQVGEASSSEGFLSQKSTLIDDRVLQLMEQLKDHVIPPASSLEYELKREYEAAELRLAVHLRPVKTSDGPGEDGPVEPSGFRWKGQEFSGLTPTAFRLLKFHWSNDKWLTRYFNKDPYGLDVFQDAAVVINRGLVDSHQTKINHAFVDSEMLLYMKVEKEKTFVREITQGEFDKRRKRRVKRKKS